MRILLRFVVAGLVAAASGCQRPQTAAPPVVRWDFAGSAALAQQAEAPMLKTALTLPESDAAGAALATNLTRSLWVLLSGRTNAPAEVISSGAPLMRELVRAESSGGVWAREGGGKDFALSARLEASRAEPMREAVVRFLTSAGVTNASSASASATNGWITIASAPAAATRLHADPGLSGALLRLEIDFAAVRSSWPFDFLSPPRATFTAVATNKIVRISGRLKFTEPIAMDLEAWRPPVPVMYDPIVTFTAARGVKSLFERCAWYRELNPGTAPNQVFLWDQSLVALQKFIAAPMAEPDRFMDAVAAKVGPLFDTNAPSRKVLGEMTYSTNRHSILVQALPAAVPFLGPIRTNDTDYVLGGLYIPTRTSNQPPAQLLKQLERPNLVAYDWEITAESAMHWRAIRQFEDIALLRPVIPGNAPGQKWFLAATPKLANTVTEITRISPTEYEVLRSSPAGLSGFELVQFIRWIDDETRGQRLPANRSGTRLVPASKPGTQSKPGR